MPRSSGLQGSTSKPPGSTSKPLRAPPSRNARPRNLGIEEVDNNVARLFEARPDAAPVMSSRRYMVDGFNGSPSIFKAYPAWANTAQAELVAAQFTACRFSSSGSLAMLAAMRRTKTLSGTSVPFGYTLVTAALRAMW